MGEGVFKTWQIYAALILATLGSEVSHRWSPVAGGFVVGVAVMWAYLQGCASITRKEY